MSLACVELIEVNASILHSTVKMTVTSFHAGSRSLYIQYITIALMWKRARAIMWMNVMHQ